MQVVCPQCRSVYKAPDSLPQTARFNCKKCGLTATLGQIQQAQQEQLSNSQLEESDLDVVTLDALPVPGMGGGAPVQQPMATAPPQQRGLGFADDGGGGLDLADAAPARAAQPARQQAANRGGGGGGLDLLDDDEDEAQSYDDAEQEDEWDELQRVPEPTLAEKLQPHMKNIVVGTVAVVVILGLAIHSKNKPDPREERRRQMAQARENQGGSGQDGDSADSGQAAQSPTPAPSAAPSAAAPSGPTLEDNMAKLEELRKAEQFSEAVEFLGTMPMSHRERIRDLRKLELELEGLAKFVAQARPSMEKVKELREKDPRLARHYLERALRAHDHTVPDIPLGRELIRAQRELAQEVPFLSGGIPPETPLENPPEREAALAEAREAAAARAKELREQIDAEKNARSVQQAEEIARAREVTASEPLNMTIARGIRVTDAQLVHFDAVGFKVKSASGDEYAFEWGAVDPKVALEIRRRSVREDDAQDQMRFGYWCLRQRQFSRAGQAFRNAVKLDDNLATKVPDVSALRQASRVFHGDLELQGSRITVTYDFDDETQANDWTPEGRNVNQAVEGGVFKVSGNGLFLTELREVGFKDSAELTAIPSTKGSGNNLAVVLGLGFDVGTDAEVIYLVAAYIEAKVVALYRLQGNNFEQLSVKQKAIRGTRPRLRLKARGNRIEVSGGGTSIKQKISSSWDNCRVYVGGAGEGAGNVDIGEVRIGGRVRFSWLRKSFGEFEALLQGILARAEQLDVFEAEGEPDEEAALTAEDAFATQGVASDVLEAYRDTRADVINNADSPERLLKAIETLTDLVHESPQFAAGFFLRGVCLTQLGSPSLALPDLEQALACAPSFHEALAWKSIVLSRLGRPEEAMADAEKAVELRPDSLSLMARGALHFQRTDLPAALADLELARALEPHDVEIATLAQGVSHVVKGPGWTKKFTHETSHYVLDTNVPSGMDELSEELEVVRKYFLESFGIKDLEQAGKASVLMFDTEEGYHSYAELTTEDRGASTLGLYIPRYRQLLMFQDAADVDGTETRQTLFHEGFHQFMHQLVGDNLVPYWLNEGLAEYYSAVELKNGQIAKKGLVLRGRLDDLLTFLSQNRNRPMPFQTIMQESPAEFYSGAVWAKYAQAWAMVHYFHHGASSGDRRRFERYVKLIREGISGHDAFKAVWAEDVNWRRLEDNFVKYVMKLG
jgi:tetratricopeptide (TPR) repeat protein